MQQLQTNKVYVLHVKKGYEDRKKHIESHLGKFNIDFEFMLEGDIDDLNENVRNKYFIGEIKNDFAITSCTTKHFLCYEDMIKKNISDALILEDDILLTDNFIEIFNTCILELNTRKDLNSQDGLISFENTRLRFVPRSKLIKGQFIYKADMDRMTGAYFIKLDTAKQIMNYVDKNKCDITIDKFHEKLIRENDLKYYWCEPTIARQGSHSGYFKSSIGNDKTVLGQKLKWQMKLLYKKTLYFFR